MAGPKPDSIITLMKVTEHIEKAKGKTLFSFEILPPLKGQHVQSIFDNIDPLMEFNPPFIDVTYHREEYVYKELENGLLKKKFIPRGNLITSCWKQIER